MANQTALYDCHVALGGNMVDFANYLLPMHYQSGIITEHNAVRNAAGIFDVSHMGEFFLTGKDALTNLNYLLCNDFSDLKSNRARYSPMLNEVGGIVDDLIVYCFSKECYMLVVNASNKAKDFDWLAKHINGEVQLEDRSSEYAEIAIQGPQAEAILRTVVGYDHIPKRNYSFIPLAKLDGIDCLIAQTGYTGEQGFEIYCKEDQAVKVWQKLLEVGESFGLTPCGLGSRDTLRLEAGMPLYGHEMNDSITPLEVGLDFALKMNKEDFIGKDALEKIGSPFRRRVGLKVVGRGIIRENAPVFYQGIEIGFTTSGTHAPFLGYGIAMALLDATHCEENLEVEVEVRGRMIAAVIIPLPFYRRSK